MKKILFLVVIGCFFILIPISFAAQVKGLWVECEGSNETLSSPQKIKAMIDIAKQTGVNNIYLQVYRHNRAWYNTKYADNAPYLASWKQYRVDPLAYALKLAHKNNIKLHAWINVFRIGKDKKAPIIEQLGKGIITKDGRGKSLWSYSKSKLPDGGYWLEPGDPKVQQYQRKIVEELLYGYPELDGIHLDFIRYPYVNLNPGSKWAGKSDFGYGDRSVARFKSENGYSPLKMDLKDRYKTQQWDQWRRDQVSLFVKKIYNLVKKTKSSLVVSVAVQPWPDRAYMVAYQDWRFWLENNIVDVVVLMNYSTDRQLAKNISLAAIKLPYKPSVYIGLGAYLMLNKQGLLFQEIEDCQKLKAKGIVLFSYDAILKKRNIFSKIAKEKWWR